jgi:hypothetical protein
VTRRGFATPLLLLAGSLGVLPRPAAALAKGKTELDKLVSAARLFPLVGEEPPPFTLARPDGRRVGLVGCVQGTRGWDESPTRELIDYLLKAPAR